MLCIEREQINEISFVRNLYGFLKFMIVPYQQKGTLVSTQGKYNPHTFLQRSHSLPSKG